MNETRKTHKVRQKIFNEIQLFLIYFLFLDLLFFAFTSNERLLLGKSSYTFLPYGYCIIKALILSKVILIGESLRLGELFSNRPLVFPVIYKTIIFCILMFALTLSEHVATGLFEGKEMAIVYQELIAKKLNIVFSQTIVLFFVFIFFFSVIETSRVLGGKRLFNLFFKNRIDLQ